MDDLELSRIAATPPPTDTNDPDYWRQIAFATSRQVDAAVYVHFKFAKSVFEALRDCSADPAVLQQLQLSAESVMIRAKKILDGFNEIDHRDKPILVRQ